MAFIPQLSIVIPLYMGEKTIETLCQEICKALEQASLELFEILLIDDRSPDASWIIASNLAKKDPRIKAIRLSRNFGQHTALSAGIHLAQGNFIALMDCDGQDDPAHLPEMFATLVQKQVQIVYAIRKERKDSSLKKLKSKFIYQLISTLSGSHQDHRIGTYRMFSRLVGQAFVSLPERRRFVGGMFNWMGFSAETLEFEHKARYAGGSSYSLNKQLRLARLGILGSSTRLLSLGTLLSVTAAIASLLFGLVRVWIKWQYEIPLGYTSIIVTILLASSAILFVLGIMGEYLREVVEEVKQRPVYLVEDAVNISPEDANGFVQTDLPRNGSI
jgi:dolichol-phosphate mannosyltransferase